MLSALAIPWRENHSEAISLVLVLAVVVTASVGGLGPSLVAAAIACLTYNLFLTVPYYSLAIDKPDDAIAAGTLLIVGLAVGLLSSRSYRLMVSDTTRGSELRHLLRFAALASQTTLPKDLEALACETLTALLHLDECRWTPGVRFGEGPVLQPDGSIMGWLSDLNPDRARLPSTLDVRAIASGVEVGRFVLSPDQSHLVSLEERLTASTIVALFANALTFHP